MAVDIIRTISHFGLDTEHLQRHVQNLEVCFSSDLLYVVHIKWSCIACDINLELNSKEISCFYGIYNVQKPCAKIKPQFLGMVLGSFN